MYSWKYTAGFIVLFGFICQIDTVSFYGESYIHIPLHDAFRETNLELRFKASRPYGVIFLLSGETDYFLLQLHAGTLQLKINFGKDETVLDLGQQRYDDLQWHEVKVVSHDNQITLTMDNVTSATGAIKGSFRELNIESGAYLGGVDSKTNEKFDGNLKNFRGTFSSIVFNQMNMMSMAQRLTDPSLVVEISWDIDEIFSAPRDTAISLQSGTSFVSFSHIHPNRDRTVSFLTKTETTMALLLFSFTRHSTKKHYMALEIINGNLKFTACKGEEVLVLNSHIDITDSEWHQIDITVTSNVVELVVDGVRDSGSFNEKTGAVNGGLVYIGGVNQKARALALHEDLDSVKGDNSLKGGLIGCIKNIIINSRAYNVHDIHASRLIGAGCNEEEESCTSHDCEDGAKNRNDMMTPHSDSSRENFQILSVRPLTVEEGGRSKITKDNIEIVYDFKQFGVRESGIMIYVIGKPKNGKIVVDLGQRRTNDVFTYLDLLGNKVAYVQDGSEETSDEVVMEMEIYTNSRSKMDMPAKLQQKHAFVLPISIRPSNDPPKILLNNGVTLKIIENTKIRITSEFLAADDPDSTAENLRFLVTDKPTVGYFEKVGRIGSPIMEFTQADIDDRLIWFLHLGSGNSTVRLKLTDGFASSDPVLLNIQTVQLQLTVLKNTGISLAHGTFGLITNTNLTTSSNVPTQELEVRYDILKPPRYGKLERQQYTDSEWREVRTFAQRHIDSGHIRYRQTDPSDLPSSDQFSFKVKAKSYTTPYYFFRIQFEQIYLTLEANNVLKLLHHPYGVVSSENLLFKTNNPHLQLRNIKFVILRPPSKGDFYKIDSRKRGQINFNDGIKLRKDSMFTQADINNENIYYKLKQNSYEEINDFADLRVTTVGTSAKIFRFIMEFTPIKSDIRFINNGLNDVIEGGQKTINKNCLYIQTDNFNVFEFTVMTPPKHGVLQRVDPRTSAVIATNINEFTNDDIKDLRLVYKHDDTEAAMDSFTFTAIPVVERTSLSHNEIPEFTGSFEIQMLMRNDNPPERSVNKVFKVVRNKERLITIDDLAFNDPDIDYNVDELIYTRRGIGNGDIINAVDKSEIYTFKQKDIKDDKVMFRHYGADYGHASMVVTDGQYNQNCMFEIEAGDPYIKVIPNTGATVENKNKVIISSHNLSIETNVNAIDGDIRFVLTEYPRHGHLEVRGRSALQFDLELLKAEKVKYKHDENGVEDQFGFSVIAGNTQTQGRFSIQILLGSAAIPPRVINNHVLEATDTRRKVIEQRHLLITHTDSLAQNINYLILVLPKYGKLYRGNTMLTVNGDMTFNQLDINNGRITYQLENTSVTTDQFIFEVSNDYEALRGLEFLINIISTTLTFKVSNFTVKEGEKKALTVNHIKVNKNILEDHSVIFNINKQPNHGIIELNTNKDEAISTFTIEELKQGRVLYVHDDSDTLDDNFSLHAVLDDASKESDTRTIYVTIDGLNDEAPTIVTNTGLVVWKGSMTQLTADVLCARDPDTPADQLVYRISSPSNGHVSLLNNTFKPIVVFKQSWLDDGLIVFVHTGAATGEFSFQVSDGYNSNERTTFHVEAKQLVLTLDTNTLLNAYPNTIQPITAQHLSASTNDPQQSKPIIFTLTSKPRHGSIVTMDNGHPLEVTSFTQDEINKALIFYKHLEKLIDWTQNDTFDFRVNTLYADPLNDVNMDIYVSYGNLNAENKNQLIKTRAINVDEGGEMIVAKNNLDVSEFVRNLERLGKRVSLSFSLQNAPKHGTLLYQGRNLLKNVRFSQRNINTHELIYKHDDSNTIFDSFNLTLHLLINDTSFHGDNNGATTFGLVLNVTIQPVNDEPFELITLSPSLEIIQGFSVFINQSVLLTVDKDTVPAYLVYKIITKATNGYVAFMDQPITAIETFTQHDINDGRVIFQHDGSTDQTGSFYFQVSDGAFRPFYKKFHIYVTIINMDITQNSTVILTQSDSSVYITQANLNISTNGLRENVTYIVTRQPRYGKIHLRGREVLSFTQADIDSDHIIYKQQNMKVGGDSFECDIKYRSTDIVYLSRKVNIRVKPLVNVGPLDVPRGERVALTLHSLDAGKLSERTADNPVYTLSSGPFFGRIVRKSFTKRQVYSENYRGESGGVREVTSFSHEDVVYTKVFYVSDIDLVRNGVHDNFTYILSAFKVQPAEGVFYIGLAPSNNTPIIPVSKTTVKNDDETVTPKPVTRSGEVSGDKSPMNEGSVEPSSVKNDHVIVLAIIIPLLLLIIIAILVVFFVWRRRRKRDYAPTSKMAPRLRPHISGPYQIEQPHVHIEPQEQNSPVSEEAQSLVEYENTANIPGVSRPQSEEADVVMPMGRQDVCQIPRSPDVSRTEVSSTVPMCKVTPMIDNDDSDTDLSPDDNRKSTGSMGDMIDWITSDPELLQHCSSSEPPVLRKNQYWV